MFSIKKWLFCAVIMIFTAMPLLANEIHEKNRLVVNIKDGLVSIDAENAILSEVLKEVGRRSTPSFGVKSFTTRRVTASFKKRSLKETIDLLAKKNYAMVFDKQTNRLKMIFLLHEGSGTTTVILDTENDVAKIFPGPQGNELARIDDYTKERRECLHDIIRQEPDREVTVQVSLAEFTSAKELMSMFPDSKFTIYALSHGWGEMNGGYKINPNDSQEETLKYLIQYHEQFLQNILDATDDLVRESEQNPAREQSARALMQTAREQLSMAKQGIIMTYGAEIVGKAEDINNFIDDPKIKLVDSAECYKEITEIIKKDGYDPRTIFTSIKPENNK